MSPSEQEVQDARERRMATWLAQAIHHAYASADALAASDREAHARYEFEKAIAAADGVAYGRTLNDSGALWVRACGRRSTSTCGLIWAAWNWIRAVETRTGPLSLAWRP
jgi:hypothetical protein